MKDTEINKNFENPGDVAVQSGVAENAENQEEQPPLAEFDDSEDEKKLAYEKSVNEKKVFFANSLISNITKVVFAIICFIFTTKIPYIGGVLFILALFYFMPIGLIRTIVYLHRLIHAKNYVSLEEDDVAVDLFHIARKHLKKKNK